MICNSADSVGLPWNLFIPSECVAPCRTSFQQNIGMNSMGIHRSLLDSVGICWNELENLGELSAMSNFRWIPFHSVGFHWIPWESVGECKDLRLGAAG